MRSRAVLPWIWAHLMVAMLIAPAFAAAIADSSTEACATPLHARIVQLGASAVDLPAETCIPNTGDVLCLTNPGVGPSAELPGCPALVSARGPPATNAS